MRGYPPGSVSKVLSLNNLTDSESLKYSKYYTWTQIIHDKGFSGHDSTRETSKHAGALDTVYYKPGGSGQRFHCALFLSNYRQNREESFRLCSERFSAKARVRGIDTS